MRQFGFHVDDHECIEVKEGETLSIGRHTVTFVGAPMVHWPEAMVTFDLTDGVLIAPTFTHAGNSFPGKAKTFFMQLAGFPLHSRWTSEEYLRVLRQNGWTCLLYTSWRSAKEIRVPWVRTDCVS